VQLPRWKAEECVRAEEEENNKKGVQYPACVPANMPSSSLKVFNAVAFSHYTKQPTRWFATHKWHTTVYTTQQA